MAATTTDTSTASEEVDSKERLRNTYSKLFYEMQFRGTKNALMNYHEADIFSSKATLWSWTTHILTGLSASGILASLVQKGKVFAGNKAGLAGLVGLPICGVIQVLNNSTSEFLPSYTERARKHVSAAAGWNYLSERARSARLLLRAEGDFDEAECAHLYEQLLLKREEISKLVLISARTNQEFSLNTEQVFLAMKKRHETFKEFNRLDKEHDYSASDLEQAANIYF